jgi:exodeoxyribonuclease VII small subunit
MTSNRKQRNGTASLHGTQTAETTQQEPLAFEEALGRLDDTVAALEGGQLPLDDALTIFEEGVRLARQCQELLDRAELRVQRLRRTASSEGGDDAANVFVLETFELQDDE